MTGIGHNRAPHEAMADHVEDLFKLVSDTTELPVTTDEQEAGIEALLDDVRQVEKDAEAKRKAEKEPHLEAGRVVDANWKPVTTRCKAMADALKAALTPYRVAKQKAKDEAARKAREEAERQAEEARKAHQSADTLEDRFAAEEAIKQAAKLEQTAKRIDRAPTGLRTRQIARVIDYKVLLIHIADTDRPALDAFLEGYAQRALPAKLPGMEITIEQKAA